MAEILKQRSVRVSDEDWAAHIALAEKVGLSASDLVVRYIRRANAVAAGESVVEDDDIPAEYASTLRRGASKNSLAVTGRGQRDTSSYRLTDAPERIAPPPPEPDVKVDVPLLGTFQRGPLQKGVKREKSK